MSSETATTILGSRQHRALGVMLFLVAGLLAGLGLATELSKDWQLVLWLVWVAAGCLFLLRGGRRLFGPLVGFELARLGRRRLVFVLRFTLGLALLLALGSLYLQTKRQMEGSDRRYWGSVGQSLSPAELAEVTEKFTFTVLGSEFLLVLLLTPALVAGSIAQEKERRTLEFLLATDLDRGEIVLSKVAARLFALSAIGLVGLPLLAFAQFLGGIDFLLALGGFAAVLLTVVGLAGLSVLVSVLAARTRNALAYTYLIVAAYIGLGFGIQLYLPRFPQIAGWGSWLTVQQIVEAANQGNPAIFAWNSLQAWRRGYLHEVLPHLLMGYAIFHCLVGLGSVAAAAAVLHLDPPTSEPVRRLASRRALRVGDDPLWWREVRRNAGMNLGLVGRLIVLLLVIVSLQPFIWVIADYHPAVGPAASAPADDTERLILRGVIDLLGPAGQSRADLTLGQLLHPWVALVSTVVACLTFVAVALRAAGSIAGERDCQTLDPLLTTPYRREGILFAKWMASIWSVRWTWLWLGSIWLIGVLTGALHILSVPLLATAWAVFAALSATVGIWFSVHSASTLKASVSTLVGLTLLWFGHWLLLGCFFPFFFYSVVSLKDLPDWLILFQRNGLTPPFTMETLAFDSTTIATFKAHRIAGQGIVLVGSALCGLAFWAVVTISLWYWALARFRALAGERSLEPLAYFAASAPVEELLGFDELAAGESESSPELIRKAE